jgi:zinc transport system substrate-binding protein
MLRKLLPISILIAGLFMVSCRDKRVSQEKTQLTVSIIPQKYVASFIAGDEFDIQVMLPTGSNHETYEPTPRDIEKISSSRFYLTLGALDFELTWLDRFKASNANMKIINTSEGIEMISGHAHHDHDHAESKNQGIDPHTWLSPACVKIQAANICQALSAFDTANSEFYKANLTRFNHLADSVDTVIRTKLVGSAGKSFLIFHPALAYFARDYNLVQISIEQEGKEPSPAYLGELVRSAREKGIKTVLISKEFDTRNAEAIAREIGGKVVIFDPMSENWAENMILLAELIASN